MRPQKAVIHQLLLRQQTGCRQIAHIECSEAVDLLGCDQPQGNDLVKVCKILQMQCPPLIQFLQIQGGDVQVRGHDKPCLYQVRDLREIRIQQVILVDGCCRVEVGGVHHPFPHEFIQVCDHRAQEAGGAVQEDLVTL